MKVAFRVDASLRMGSGHLMRCLTLADALRAAGAACHFITREHPGHLIAHISQRGHRLSVLPGADDNVGEASAGPAHAAWLGATWAEDARQTAEALGAAGTDWLVVDHYAIERRWEQRLAGHCRHLMVIDDLADRAHACDLLLDQNLGQSRQDYAARVPAHCQVLAGAQFALLRPAFAELRAHSLSRRTQAGAALRNILVTMGGVDSANATAYVLRALSSVVSPSDRIRVVMGASAPWLSEVRQLADNLPCACDVLVNTDAMATLMAESDLAIGAAGSTSWERCCMGLPTLMAVVADNQRLAAERLEAAEAAFSFSIDPAQTTALQALFTGLKDSPSKLPTMSQRAASITSGQGCRQVVEKIFEMSKSIEEVE